MRVFILLILIFAAAVTLAVGAHLDPGNVVFFYPPYRIDLSLNLFVLLGLVGFFFLYGLMRLAARTYQMPERVSEYRRRQRERRSYRALRGALQSYLEGRFGHAEKEARAALEYDDTAGLAALIAARAAHRMTEYARRDEWLRLADQTPGLRAARLMTEAECLVDARDSARALEVVAQLHGAGARHIQSQRLALKASQYAGQWHEVLRLLRMLTKRGAIHPTAARQIKVMAYRALFEGLRADGYGLIAFWQDMPTADRSVPEVALAAARAFNAAHMGYQARLVIEQALAQDWNDALVAEYAACVENNSTLQIERAERWLLSHPNDVALQFALGTLCVRQRLWGKAQMYLNGALTNDSEGRYAARVHLAMARMFEELADPGHAAEHYRAAALAMPGAGAAANPWMPQEALAT